MLMGVELRCDFANEVTNQSNYMNAKHLRRIYNLLSFIQLIEEPTSVTCEKATLIDHIATTCPINVSESGIPNIALSNIYGVFY